MGFISIFMDLVCPSMGVLMATLVFAAPIADLRKALLNGSLGDLNPFPWAMMTGNCLGWVVYGYYLMPHDAFIVAANLPGLVLSIWLNSGAAKLQYQELLDMKRLDQEREASQEGWDASPGDSSDHEIVGLNEAARLQQLRRREHRRQQANILHQYHPEYLVTTPQERSLMQVLSFWILICIWVGWIGNPRYAASTVGIVVNLNLIFFYGAPLKTIKNVVINDRHSNSIHRPTMYMTWINTSFWIIYGLARMDFVIVVPNVIGLSLGMVQGLLCFLYPPTTTSPTTAASQQPHHEPLSLNDNDVDDDDDNHSNAHSVVETRQPERPTTLSNSNAKISLTAGGSKR